MAKTKSQKEIEKEAAEMLKDERTDDSKKNGASAGGDGKNDDSQGGSGGETPEGASAGGEAAESDNEEKEPDNKEKKPFDEEKESDIVSYNVRVKCEACKNKRSGRVLRPQGKPAKKNQKVSAITCIHCGSKHTKIVKVLGREE